MVHWEYGATTKTAAHTACFDRWGSRLWQNDPVKKSIESCVAGKIRERMLTERVLLGTNSIELRCIAQRIQ